MATRDLRIAITTEGKYFVAQCLDVDVSSFGETEQEALKAIHEALELYFESIGPDVKQPKIVNLKLQSA
jgi:predicted RNase H-like HicB family nuclease